MTPDSSYASRKWLQLCSVRPDSVLYGPFFRGMPRRGVWVNWRRWKNPGASGPRNEFAPNEFPNFEGVAQAIRHDLSRYGLEAVSLATVVPADRRSEFQQLIVEVKRKGQ